MLLNLFTIKKNQRIICNISDKINKDFLFTSIQMSFNTRMTSMKIVEFSKTPHSSQLCPSTSKILPPPLTLEVQFQTNPPLAT